MKKYTIVEHCLCAVVLVWFIIMIIIIATTMHDILVEPTATPIPSENEEMVYEITVVRKNLCATPAPTIAEKTLERPNPNKINISEADASLIAVITMAEAEGESEEGKRLVIDTILNRMLDPHFPDTVYEVIYQKNQFASVWNGRADRCYVKEDILQLVWEETEERYNNDVVFFRTSHYSKYGRPLFKVGHHYFSAY